ncbi:MAG: diguanylate cyclase [Sphingomonas sp.]|uniref:sensor domain-containing diguanylate cyclase n=1 Tax=Sphingomonas sp. TaxID=28214 RepID=UPI0025D1A4A1|nr:diguanylate cyclase [Sphingomonas sp.]MBX9882901.1 diguanylate cyclase [Sphingomonas sp.]
MHAPLRAIDSQRAAGWLRAGMVGLGYFALAAALIRLTSFEGGLAALWVASGLLTAELVRLPRHRWGPTLTACTLASVLATGLVGLGWAVAVPLALVNMTESVVAALLLRLWRRGDDALDSVDAVIGLLLAAACAALVTALPAAALSGLATGRPMFAEASAWLLGHGLGQLTVAPFFLLLLNGELGLWWRQATLLRRMEAAAHLLMIGAVSVIVFGQAVLPLLFVPILPLMLVTFRLERVGTTVAIVVLGLIGGIFTALGHGGTYVIGGSVADHVRLFQGYLGVTVLTVLPVAAELRLRRATLDRPAESEARYKLITESATDMIVTLDAAGVVNYVSPSAREVTGFEPAVMIGATPAELPCGPDRATMQKAIDAARARPGERSVVEYRADHASGERRWYEAHTRAAVSGGRITGWVSTVRDISGRKALEARLAHAATTDPLTGLANRRKFDSILDRRIEATDGGCIALFDIDFFKRVNDAHGHAVGDLVLETFARSALACVRAGDHVARLGGEEFGLILPGATIEQAAMVCERVRAAVADAVTTTPGGISVRVTVSAGLAEITPGAERLQLIRAADEALYRAKASGRDRYAVAA